MIVSMSSNKPRNPSRPIGGDGFNGTEELSPADWASLVVDDLTSSAKNLLPTDYSLMVVPGLSLNNDNSKPSTLGLFLQGELLKKINKFPATKFWPLVTNKNLHIVFNQLPGNLFRFGNDMTSDLVDSSEIEFRFIKKVKKDDVIVEKAEATELGVGNFCLKAHMTPTKPNRAAYYISLFPESEATLRRDHPLCCNPRFPGINILNGELNIHIKTSTWFKEKSTGCPILPAICLGANPVSHPITLSMKAVKEALSVLLRKALKPENNKNHDLLLRRWQAIKTGGERELRDCTPDFSWQGPNELWCAGMKFLLSASCDCLPARQQELVVLVVLRFKNFT